MEPKDKYLDYARVNKDKFIETKKKKKIPDDEKDAVFMAGSPGAGKTEVALGLA